MARIIFAIVGLVVAALPDAILKRYEQVAFENPNDARAKPWLVGAIRAEGVLYALAALGGGKVYAWLLHLAGAFGALALAFPRRYLETGGRIAYENSTDLEWDDRFVTGVRVLGAMLVCLALLDVRNRRYTDAKADKGAATGGQDEATVSDSD